MKKYAYLSRLEELLADLPQSERQDALNYYEDSAFSGGTTLGKTSYGGTVYTEQTARAGACRLQVRAEVGGIQIRFTH